MVILSVLKRCRQVQKLVGSQSWDLILFVPQLLKKHRIFDVETWHRFQQISKGLGIDVAESNDLADVHKQQVSGSVLWPFFMSPLPTLHSSCYFTCFSTCLTCLVISGLFVSVPGCCDEADLSCFVGSATFTSLQFSCVSWVLPVIGPHFLPGSFWPSSRSWAMMPLDVRGDVFWHIFLLSELGVGSTKALHHHCRLLRWRTRDPRGDGFPLSD